MDWLDKLLGLEEKDKHVYSSSRALGQKQKR